MLMLSLLFGLLLLSHNCDAHLNVRDANSDASMVLQRWHYSTRKLAQEIMGDKLTSSNSDYLALVVLLTDFDRKDKNRLETLHTSVQLCARNLFPSTPSKLYVFTFEHQVSTVKQRLGELMQPNVAVLPILNSTWKMPRFAANRDHWHSFQNADYRIMGDWRLTFMPKFVRSMGHRYVMQIDDDSYILEPLRSNLVQLFDQRGYLLAARNIQRDPVIVTWGLPEMARFFLVTNKIVPETLFDYCEPPNIDGLYSELKRQKLEEGLVPKEQLDRLERLGIRSRGGWNRTILFGNCLMYSLEWYFQAEVQRFVHMCRSTGASFIYRWNEQGVIAMLWQIFVPRDKFLAFNFKYGHRFNSSYALQLAEEYGDMNTTRRFK